MSSVKYSDLELAMEFVGSGEMLDSCAYISRDTGEIYWGSAEINLDEEIPDDVDDHDRYAVVPDKRDLDLGNRLDLRFVSEALPDRHEEIQAIFRLIEIEEDAREKNQKGQIGEHIIGKKHLADKWD